MVKLPTFENELLSCSNYQEQRCRSCGLIEQPYTLQLQGKQAILLEKLASFIQPSTITYPPMRSPIDQFRYKAKMVVAGSVEKVTLGLINDAIDGVDLTECPLYPESLRKIFPILKRYIQAVGLVPYHIKTKKGILKYILLTQSQANHQVMVRFVLKDETKIDKMQQHLSMLLDYKEITVVSANIQPIHQAILEGEKEIILTSVKRITEHFNGIDLFIQPQSFFQTHPSLAQVLYATAAQWGTAHHPNQIWDLFCGVGGFGLHMLKALEAKQLSAKLIGIEIEPNAIASAKESADRMGFAQVQFEALDSTLFAINQRQAPELLVVNPPRRGLGKTLAVAINLLDTDIIIYSSCHIDSLEADLAYLTNYQIIQQQLFDFFPHTPHFEVLVMLQKRSSG